MPRTGNSSDYADNVDSTMHDNVDSTMHDNSGVECMTIQEESP